MHFGGCPGNSSGNSSCLSALATIAPDCLISSRRLWSVRDRLRVQLLGPLNRYISALPLLPPDPYFSKRSGWALGCDPPRRRSCTGCSPQRESSSVPTLHRPLRRPKQPRPELLSVEQADTAGSIRHEATLRVVTEVEPLTVGSGASFRCGSSLAMHLPLVVWIANLRFDLFLRRSINESLRHSVEPRPNQELSKDASRSLYASRGRGTSSPGAQRVAY